MKWEVIEICNSKAYQYRLSIKNSNSSNRTKVDKVSQKKIPTKKTKSNEAKDSEL